MIRDPKDVLVSMYHFHEGWRFEPGAITMADYSRNFFLVPERSRRYWQYVGSWWPQRVREDVLLLSYEAALADVPGTVRRVAGFIGCPLDGGLLDIVVRQSSIEFMKAHGSQFDDHVVRAARNAANGLPPGGSSSKVRGGRVGDHVDELPWTYGKRWTGSGAKRWKTVSGWGRTGTWLPLSGLPAALLR